MKVKPKTQAIVDEKARQAIVALANQLYGTMLSRDFIEGIVKYLDLSEKKEPTK